MKKVLVIDDDETLTMVLVETLEMLGFETLTAADGATGIETAVTQAPDLILCDVSMPSMDGFETLQRIRETPSISKIPFVLCSGFSDQATRQKALKLGATDVVGKPVAVSDLLSMLNLHLKAAA